MQPDRDTIQEHALEYWSTDFGNKLQTETVRHITISVCNSMHIEGVRVSERDQ